MMWPNDFALFVVEFFNLTSDRAVGVTVMLSIIVYLAVVVGIPTSIVAYFYQKVSSDDNQMG